MSERRTQDALEEIAEYATEAFVVDEEDEVDPYEIYTEVFGGAKTQGEVQPVVGDPELYASTRDELLNGRTYGTTYGMDAGSFPRIYDFVGGAKMNVANAVFGHTNGNSELTNHRTLAAALYKDTGEPEYQTKKVFEKNYEYNSRHSTVTASAITLPEPSEGSINEWVNSASLMYAESNHLLNYVDELDGALFIDGPIFPPGLAHDSIFARENPSQVSDELGDSIHDILHTYGKAIEKQWLSGHPVFGIVKTINTKEVRQSIFEKALWVYDKDEEIRLPWPTDDSFFSDLLQPEDNTRQFTHTSWMVRAHRTWKGTPHQVFANADLDAVQPHDLARAFFYVRLPTGEVFRIETPAGFVRGVEQEQRDLMKQYALWEVAKTRDTAQAIKNADADASLSRELRDTISEKVEEQGNLKQERDYNKDRRWSDLDYTGDK